MIVNDLSIPDVMAKTKFLICFPLNYSTDPDQVEKWNRSSSQSSNALKRNLMHIGRIKPSGSCLRAKELEKQKETNQIHRTLPESPLLELSRLFAYYQGKIPKLIQPIQDAQEAMEHQEEQNLE
ncbi:unnamed protein product [Caenorhabditis brenneri]